MGLLKLVVSSTESMPDHYRTMFFQAIHGHDGYDDDIALLLEAENSDGVSEMVTRPSQRAKRAIHITIAILITYFIRANTFVLSRFSHGIRTQQFSREKKKKKPFLRPSSASGLLG